MKSFAKAPLYSLWKIYIIPISVCAIFNYLIYYAFYLDNQMQYVLRFYIIFSVTTLMMAGIFYKSLQKNILCFVKNFIGAKIVKFLITLIMLIVFFKD